MLLLVAVGLCFSLSQLWTVVPAFSSIFFLSKHPTEQIDPNAQDGIRGDRFLWQKMKPIRGPKAQSKRTKLDKLAVRGLLPLWLCHMHLYSLSFYLTESKRLKGGEAKKIRTPFIRLFLYLFLRGKVGSQTWVQKENFDQCYVVCDVISHMIVLDMKENIWEGGRGILSLWGQCGFYFRVWIPLSIGPIL